MVRNVWFSANRRVESLHSGARFNAAIRSRSTKAIPRKQPETPTPDPLPVRPNVRKKSADVLQAVSLQVPTKKHRRTNPTISIPAAPKAPHPFHLIVLSEYHARQTIATSTERVVQQSCATGGSHTLANAQKQSECLSITTETRRNTGNDIRRPLCHCVTVSLRLCGLKELPNSHYTFRTTQVVMHRSPCTFTVLIGSSCSAPSRAPHFSSIASFTRNRSLPSGR
jgi:hypothetical protein